MYRNSATKAWELLTVIYYFQQACSINCALQSTFKALFISTTFIQSRWQNSSLVMELDFASVHKQTEKDLGQYPPIVTSHLVNNPYLLYG